MKVYKKYMSLLFLVIPVAGLSQVSFEIAGGFATYQMNDLKTINTQQAKSLPIETVEVDNFDPGWYLKTSLKYISSEDFRFGMVYCYNSTGSRIGQRDYSGYYAFDQIVDCHFLGIEPETFIAQNKNMGISLSLLTGLNFTGLELRQVLSLQGQESEDSQSLVALSVSINPAVNLYLPIHGALSGKISLGYLYDTGGKLHLKGNRNAVLTLLNNPVKTGWTGFRIAAGICFRVD